MSENETVTVDKRHFDKMQVGYLYCSIALEQVLADIVAEKGDAYLDYVVERSVRRIAEQQMAAIETVPEEPIRESFANVVATNSSTGEEILRTVVQRVKSDPTPVL